MVNACALVQGDAHTALHTFPAHRISNKVDVWSAGVILYQMLFGRRPFGEGMTQEQILRDRVMLNAREVGGRRRVEGALGKGGRGGQLWEIKGRRNRVFEDASY